MTANQAGPFGYGDMFCAFQIAITGDGNAPVAADPSYFYVVSATGVRYNALPAPYMMMGMMGGFPGHYCSAADIVSPDETVVCWIELIMPWVSVGDLWFDGGGYQDHVPFRFP